MDIELLTETRGGYDEWSDQYELVIGVRVNGDEYRERRFKDQFVDESGNSVVVEFPRRGHEKQVDVEWYNPYEHEKVHIDTFEDRFEESASQ